MAIEMGIALPFAERERGVDLLEHITHSSLALYSELSIAKNLPSTCLALLSLFYSNPATREA